MKGPTHGALVAGVSSGIVAAWARKKAWDRYDPELKPPSYRERVKMRAPIIAKGIAFTGLTWAVGREFDRIEATILADSHTGYKSDINTKTHRNLHSLPYLGPFFIAARLVKQNSESLSEWIGKKFHMPDNIEAISKSLEEFADWILNYPSLGAVGHIVGDLPTSGHGGTALNLLTPIINENFALGVISSSSVLWNELLFKAGALLSGASWMLTTIYLLSWKPPELKIQDYANKIKDCESVEAMIKQIFVDIEQRLTEAFELGKQTIFDLPAFKNSTREIRENPFQNWFELDISPTVFGLNTFGKDCLREKGILPPDFSSRIETSSLYEENQIWPTIDETLLVVSNKAITQESSSLFTSENEFQSTPLFNEETEPSTMSIYNKDKSDTDDDEFTGQI